MGLNIIEMTRGDTVRLTVNLIDTEGLPYTLQDGEKLEFTVKDNPYTEEVLIQKEVIGGKVVIENIDTRYLAYKDYIYDVQLTKLNGDIVTVVKPDVFRVTKEVNFNV